MMNKTLYKFFTFLVIALVIRQSNTKSNDKEKRKLQIGIKKQAESCVLKAKQGDRLSVHYTGMLKNGTVFDTTHGSAEPFVFVIGINQVIKGLDQGLLEMCETEKRVLIVPSHLAYDSKGLGDKIPPYSTLKYEIELVKIDRKPDISKVSTKSKNEQQLSVEYYRKNEKNCTMRAKKGETVTAHYIGYLENATIFETSYSNNKDGNPSKFVLGYGRVMRGWDRGLIGTCASDSLFLTVPPSMHPFNNQDNSYKIKPGTVLRFDFEIIKVEHIEIPKFELDRWAEANTANDKANEEEAKITTKNKSEL